MCGSFSITEKKDESYGAESTGWTLRTTLADCQDTIKDVKFAPRRHELRLVRKLDANK